MKYASRTSHPHSLYRQKGFVFRLIHSMLIIAIAVVLVLLYQHGHLRFLRHIPGDIARFLEDEPRGDNGYNDRSDNGSGSSRYWRTDYREHSSSSQGNSGHGQKEPALYSVQLAAAYDSRTLYYWRDELLRNGYKAYLVRANTADGMLFKLRVGPYNDRYQAEKTRWNLGQYSQNFTDGFIVAGE